MEFGNLVTIKEKGYWIKRGIEKMKTYENKTYLLIIYHLVATILDRLSSCNKYSHAHIVICKLEKKPSTIYRPLIVVAYCL
jgi:hypothetical protein